MINELKKLGFYENGIKKFNRDKILIIYAESTSINRFKFDVRYREIIRFKDYEEFYLIIHLKEIDKYCLLLGEDVFTLINNDHDIVPNKECSYNIFEDIEEEHPIVIIKNLSHEHDLVKEVYLEKEEVLSILSGFINNKEQEKSMKNLKKEDLKNICKNNGINLPNQFSFATKNISKDVYWSNARKDFLEMDWWLILNDNINKQLHCLFIPQNSISQNDIRMRNEKLMHIEILYNNKNYTDIKSNLDFGKWLVKVIDY